MSGGKGPRVSYWVFTLNNPDESNCFQDPAAWFCFDWCIWSLERSASGTIHLQGYGYCKDRCRLSELKKFSTSAHFQPRKGTHQEAKDYVLKHGTKYDDGTHLMGPWSYGTEPANTGSGSRSDLSGLKEAIHADKDMWTIAQDNFDTYLRYSNGIQKYMNMYTASKGGREWVTEVIVLVGPTGCGKSFAAKALDPNAFWKTRDQGSTNWWDGYLGQQTIVLDEFYGWLSWDFLLRLLDRYKLDLPIKGAFTPCLAKRIVITSNAHPDTWYKYENSKKHYEALLRRITHLAVKGPEQANTTDGEWVFEKGSINLPKVTESMII